MENSKPTFRDEDAAVFVGADKLPYYKQQGIVQACRFVCIEKGLNKPEQFTEFLATRLKLIGCSGIVYTSGLPPKIAALRGRPNVTPSQIGCDAFLLITARNDATNVRSVSVIPVLFEELKALKRTFKGGLT